MVNASYLSLGIYNPEIASVRDGSNCRPPKKLSLVDHATRIGGCVQWLRGHGIAELVRNGQRYLRNNGLLQGYSTFSTRQPTGN